MSVRAVELLTMKDLAAAWQVKLSTAYGYVAEVVRDFPEREWYNPGRRGRRFTPAQARAITEQIWGSPSTLPAPERETGTGSPASTSGLRSGNSSSKRQGTAALRDALQANSRPRSGLVIAFPRTPRPRPSPR